MSRFLNDNLQSLKAYTPGEQPRVRNLIKLNTNESPYPPSPRAVEAITKQVLCDTRLYSDIASSDLCRAIGENIDADPECVLTGNGSDEILSFIFLAYGARGACFPDVTYGFYKVWARLYGIDARVIPLGEDYSIRPDDYLSNDRMVVLANPNAPTGMALGLYDIETVVAANPDQIVVVDEAYVDFGGESAAPLTKKYDNLIVVQTFSKSRCLAGARLGFAVACPELIADINKMKFSINPYNVNTLTQLMGAAAMRDREYFNDCVERIIEAREYTAASLREMGFTVLPSRANFLFAAPPDGDGAKYQRSLRERAILVRHFEGARTSPFVRISIGTMEQMRELLKVTAEVSVKHCTE